MTTFALKEQLKSKLKSQHLELMQSLEKEYEQRFIDLMRQKQEICVKLLHEYYSLMQKIDAHAFENSRSHHHPAVSDITISELCAGALDRLEVHHAPPHTDNAVETKADGSVKLASSCEVMSLPDEIPLDDIPLEIEIDEANMQCDIDVDVDDDKLLKLPRLEECKDDIGDDQHSDHESDSCTDSPEMVDDDATDSQTTVCTTTTTTTNRRMTGKRRGRKSCPGKQSQKRHKCRYCEYRSDHTSVITIHERIHTGVKPYQCTLCGYRAAQKGAVVQHMDNRKCRANQRLLKKEHQQQQQQQQAANGDNGLCAACKQIFASDTCTEQQWIECEFCNEWYHVVCSGLSEEDFAKYESGENADKYKCPSCKRQD
mmetsp:Transcript_58029/g.96229  ORF Transcript_58029/g.96229 Transcript_58029/m.96229 type:complete len:371 (-) Transcript_58029:116-1228(-)